MSSKFFRIAFGAIAVGFVFILVGIMVVRSGERTSLVERSGQIDKREELASVPAAGDLEASENALHLRDFHRVEVKNGVRAWEVRAKDATHYAAEGVTHVNDATVTIYRPKRSTIELRSRVAKLHLEGEALSRAELEGDIRVILDGDYVVRSAFASYDVASEKIIAPGRVVIDGPGYSLEGEGMDFDIATRNVDLKRNVFSVFRPGHSASKAIPEMNF